PYLDSAYKLVEYAGTPRMKLATHKATLPHRKQIYRRRDPEGTPAGDTIAGGEEAGMEGEPLLGTVMRAGKRTLPRRDLDEIRSHASRERSHLPVELRGIQAATSPYPVTVSQGLRDAVARLRGALGGGSAPR
ncbi:MAG TPA: nicotinate phosphoribosyltransferase, partial [Gammaproteobacteria bacterium]|nr:nicotinate phosphoribosyltransferase [Gammaproteobacteria bacterium]